MCTKCKPERVYTRLFDVTEQTGKFRHETGRKCHRCGRPLRDSIVHFGEKGTVASPLNWRAAIDTAEETDMILCLGSSLKVNRLSCSGDSESILYDASLFPPPPSWRKIWWQFHTFYMHIKRKTTTLSRLEKKISQNVNCLQIFRNVCKKKTEITL